MEIRNYDCHFFPWGILAMRRYFGDNDNIRDSLKWVNHGFYQHRRKGDTQEEELTTGIFFQQYYDANFLSPYRI